MRCSAWPFVLGSATLVLGCEKEYAEQAAPSTAAPTFTECADVIAEDLDPDLVLHWQAFQPAPLMDSLDVDGDGVFDLRCVLNIGGQVTPSAVHDHSMSVWALDSTRIISIGMYCDLGGPCTPRTVWNDTLRTDDPVRSSTTLRQMAQSSGIYCSCYEGGGAYVGFVLTRDGLKYCGYALARTAHGGADFMNEWNELRVLRVVVAQCPGEPLIVRW